MSIAYQRLDTEVPPPSAAIDGVPTQFDEFVACATSRNPAERYADAVEMGADLAAIVEELGLPNFRVPTPRNSAQHKSLAQHHSRVAAQRVPQPGPPPGRAAPPPPVHNPTRQFTRDPDDWPEPAGAAQPAGQADYDDLDAEYETDSGEFAGIPLDEFAWARQHSRRMVVIWLAVVLALTGLVATAGWELGVHLSSLL